MPLLDDMARKITAALPQWLSGQQSYPEGYAQVRATRQPMYVIPDERWGKVSADVGQSGDYGDTVQRASWLDALTAGTPEGRNIFRSARSQPTVVLPQRETVAGTMRSPSGYSADERNPSGGIPASTVQQHEILHQIHDPERDHTDVSKILALLGERGRGALIKQGYTDPLSQASEVLPRLLTEPSSLDMTEDEGTRLGKEYMKFLSPERAQQVANYMRIPYARSSDNHPQGPNVTF